MSVTDVEILAGGAIDYEARLKELEKEKIALYRRLGVLTGDETVEQVAEMQTRLAAISLMVEPDSALHRMARAQASAAYRASLGAYKPAGLSPETRQRWQERIVEIRGQLDGRLSIPFTDMQIQSISSGLPGVAAACQAENRKAIEDEMRDLQAKLEAADKR